MTHEKIKHWQKVQSLVGRWNPSDIGFLEALCFFADPVENVPNLQITFGACRRERDAKWFESDSPQYSIEVLFQNIRGLKMNELSETRVQLSGFYIDDISDKGWERINFVVGDYENDCLFFYCETVEILEVKQVEQS